MLRREPLQESIVPQQRSHAVEMSAMIPVRHANSSEPLTFLTKHATERSEYASFITFQHPPTDWQSGNTSHRRCNRSHTPFNEACYQRELWRKRVSSSG